MDERESYWARRLESHIGQTIEIQAAHNGLPVSFNGVVAREGDGYLLKAERGIYPIMLGQNASGQPVVRPEIVPASEYEVYLGDIVAITRRLETQEQAAETLRQEGKLPADIGGRRVVTPPQGLFVPKG
jgi:hypothetical protein